jgi:hypothetical protein
VLNKISIIAYRELVKLKFLKYPYFLKLLTISGKQHSQSSLMKEKIKLKNKYLPFLFFGLVTTFFVIRNLIHEKNLKDASRYTVGHVKEISTVVDGGPMAEYTYQVNGKTYNGVFTLPSQEKSNPEPKLSVNVKFLVKFNLKNPAINFPMTEVRLRDTAEAPDSGWAEIPSK